MGQALPYGGAWLQQRLCCRAGVAHGDRWPLATLSRPKELELNPPDAQIAEDLAQDIVFQLGDAAIKGRLAGSAREGVLKEGILQLGQLHQEPVHAPGEGLRLMLCKDLLQLQPTDDVLVEVVLELRAELTGAGEAVGHQHVQHQLPERPELVAMALQHPLKARNLALPRAVALQHLLESDAPVVGMCGAVDEKAKARPQTEATADTREAVMAMRMAKGVRRSNESCNAPSRIGQRVCRSKLRMAYI